VQDSLLRHWIGNGSDSIPNVDLNDSPISAGFNELLKAYEYACDAGRSVWDLAVEMSLLRKLGLTPSDLRWLVCKGYVQHARDVTRPDDDSREFRSSAELTFSKRSCFVLTDEGAAYARSLLSKECRIPALQSRESKGSSSNGNGKSTVPASAIKPRWDGARHELWAGDQLVKQFKGQALNQETILAVFEEEGWPSRIDDPLPLADEIDPKRRLHDTIKCLNRKQRHELIHFRGDGTGEGIIWELNGLRD
jgi:hypothetical protein